MMILLLQEVKEKANWRTVNSNNLFLCQCPNFTLLLWFTHEKEECIKMVGAFSQNLLWLRLKEESKTLLTGGNPINEISSI